MSQLNQARVTQKKERERVKFPLIRDNFSSDETPCWQTFWSRNTFTLLLLKITLSPFFFHSEDLKAPICMRETRRERQGEREELEYKWKGRSKERETVEFSNK